jgi:hypothetical protein
MADTFSKIQTITVGAGGASSINFTSIPQNFTDLCVKISGRTENVYFRDSVEIRPNSATTNREGIFVIGQGAVVSSGSSTGLIVVEIEGNDGVTANTFGNAEVYITNYASSSSKCFSIEAVTENNAAGNNAICISSGLWSNAAAITSLLFTGGTWMQYSTATLYGIKNS